MTQSEQEQFVKDVEAAFEPIVKRVESKELACAIVAVTGGYQPNTISWFLEYGNLCGLRDLSHWFNKGGPIFLKESGWLETFMPMLTSSRIDSAVFLAYLPDKEKYIYEMIGLKNNCHWMIQEHELRNDQIIRTEVSYITGQNLALRQAAQGRIVNPKDLGGPNFFRGRN